MTTHVQLVIKQNYIQGFSVWILLGRKIAVLLYSTFEFSSLSQLFIISIS